MNSIFYLGMDVHKETIGIAVFRDHYNKVEFERQLRNESGQIIKFFKQLQDKGGGTILSCYEAGLTGFNLYRLLEEIDFSCYVAAPSLLPSKTGDKIKTDRRDAIMLARILRNQEITSVHISTRSDDSIHDYLRMCNDMRNDLKKQKQRLLQFLLRIGKKYDTGKGYWTCVHRTWLKSLVFAEAIHKEVFDKYYTTFLEQEAKITCLKEKIEEISTEKRSVEMVLTLRCFKGIDTLTALTFVAEIGDFLRFRKAQEFMAYLGLVPSEHLSGSGVTSFQNVVEWQECNKLQACS